MLPGYKRILAVLLVMAMSLLMTGNAQAVYKGDGATPNGSGGWNIPAPTTHVNCLECHNSAMVYAAPDVSNYVKTGHKNMLRLVTPGTPWAGAAGSAYTTDQSGNAFDWLLGKINVSGAMKDLFYIYDGWIADTPRAVYDGGYSNLCDVTATYATRSACTTAKKSWDSVLNICSDSTKTAGSCSSSGTWRAGVKPTQSYSCGRCHNTGWTSDSALNTAKHPELDFPGITWNGVAGDQGGSGKINFGGGVAGDPNQVFSSWALTGIQCERCHGEGGHGYVAASCSDAVSPDEASCIAAGGTWTPASYPVQKPTGSAATALCMECHRQETSGWPNVYSNGIVGTISGNTSATARPADQLLTGGHGSPAPEFDSHSHGNQFLNSPHARFSGTFNEIGSSPSTTPYESHFYYYGGGCTGCHNVHESTVAAVNGAPMKRECGVSCHQARRLNEMKHPTGPGTPQGDMSNIAKACETCHMPEGMHLFRINVDAEYKTFPDAASFYGGSCTDPTKTSSSACTSAGGTWTAAAQSRLANAAPEGDYANAVWVDLEASCGQCHGGGEVQSRTTGTVTAGKTLLTLADGTNFKSGQGVLVVGAGKNGDDLKTWVATVGSGPQANQVTLFDAASTSVVNAPVIANPSIAGYYFTNSQLATYAKNMHNSIPQARFNWSTDSTTSYRVNFDAGNTTCPSGVMCNYSWDFGDGSTGAGLTISHSYADGAVRTVVLTVDTTGSFYTTANASQSVTPVSVNQAPTAAGLAGATGSNYTVSFTDASVDAAGNSPAGIATNMVNWGDGSATPCTTGGTCSHTYTSGSTFTITHTVTNAAGLGANERRSMTVPQKFSAGGTVTHGSPATGLQGATMILKYNGATKAVITTAADGSFSFNNLLPGTYVVQPYKSGTVFSPANQSVTVGPSSTSVNFTATP